VKKEKRKIKTSDKISELAHKLIVDGAKVIQPQTFLGYPRQCSETILEIGCHKGKLKFYRKTPFPFIFESDGWPCFLSKSKRKK